MAPSAKAAYDPAPKSLHYEFGGVIGALGVTLAVPYFSYALAYLCTDQACPAWPVSNLLQFFSNGFAGMRELNWWGELISWEGMAVYGAWYAFTVLCWALLPGKIVEGQVMRNGESLKYKMNAFSTLVLSLAITIGYSLLVDLKPLLYVSAHWSELISASLIMSITQAIFVYVQSFQKDMMLAVGGNTPSSFFNWFIGRSLNPRLGSFDIKAFNEMRPGLILWVLIDLAMVAAQYDKIGRVTDSMFLVVLFHTWYVVDAEWNEAAILSTMDITTDGFGFMLAVGDLTWVPFTYCYSARYLSLYPNDLGMYGTAAILAVQFLGYWIFRGSNGEKNEFRQGRNPKNLQYLQTERGTQLLTSGWWGISQHPNYLGDWIMSWAWCLPAGFSTPLPYFYVVFFAILLVHRQIRDDEACEHKYGKDWAKYKKLVPSRIIPYIY